MKILIVGAGGMLGTDLMRTLEEEYPIGVDIDRVDITDLEQVLNLVGEIKPDAIVNCAAYTNVDGCESEPDLAYRVNAMGPRNLAVAAGEYGASLLHLSTDYVFDGAKPGGYLEGDPVNPLSVYGRSKLDGEAHVRALLRRHYIVRTQWLYGKNGKNFVETMLSMAREGKAVKVVDDQYGSPTYTGDLCGAIAALIRTKAYGTYHLTNSDVTCWYDFAKLIFKLSGMEYISVTPCTTAEYPRLAKRPAFSRLINKNWELSGFAPMRAYEEALRDYLRK